MNKKFKRILILAAIAIIGVFLVTLIFDKIIFSVDNSEVEAGVMESEAIKEKIAGEAIEPEIIERSPANLPDAEDVLEIDDPSAALRAGENVVSTSTPEALNILIDVPFTPQAPFAEWSDPVHQDGCEEAVSLMAVYWAAQEELSPVISKKTIVAASNFQEVEYGEYRDTSAEDTAERIIKGYFNYENYEVKKEITIKDIIAELKKGNVVILPMDGRALNNPYYTPPGPERHMIVVIGYDEVKKEFITNDPGTKKGENFSYPEKRLFGAIRDYPSGFHTPIEKIEKNMIIIKPKNK